MKVKIEKVNIGLYEYDSVVVKIENKRTEIAFRKEDKVSQYEGKEVDLTNEKGVYKIKPITTSSAVKKNND